jgi:hypothetical protein
MAQVRHALPAPGPESLGVSPANASSTVELSRPVPQASEVPLDDLPPQARELVRNVIMQPTVSGCGPAEEFPGRLSVFRWLLDHPDRAARAWRQLGAPAMNITSRGADHFTWSGPHGSNVSWDTIYRGPQMCIWYAEGHVRPGALLPSFPVRSVVVMHHSEHLDWLGRPMIQEHADLFLQTNSAATAWMVRLIGPSLPRLTEQCLGQLGMFFSALTNYLYRHPEQAAALVGMNELADR